MQGLAEGVGRTIAQSTPLPRRDPSPPAGAPNVVLVVLDDLGFGHLGCFGSDIATPAIDGLAAGGLRYRSFHVTAMCSPTRAALLTGRNHHAVGMGFLPEIPIGFDGYDARLPPSAAALPRILRDAGWSTFAVGKWHLTPRWENSASGPFTRWPLGVGFERYYGFLGGDTNQWAPELVRDNGFVEPPRTPEDGYHLTEDLVDQTIRLVLDQQQATPGKPFFLYLAAGATHAPHQVPRPWIDRYAGAFDDGWEDWRERTFDRQLSAGVVPTGTVLTERPPWVPPWSSLGSDERRLFARMMEVYAGFLSHTDAQLGRLVSFLQGLGALDNTLLLVMSDNGASAEGGPHGSFNEHRFTHDRLDDLADTLGRIDQLGGHRAYNHYAWGWAWAGNTPFRLWKRYTWLGGVRVPLVVHWPAASLRPAGVRGQFAHAVDVMPTVLEACGVPPPATVDGVEQQPMAGASLMATLHDEEAPAPRRTQYFELLGSRAIYHDGWKATTDHVGAQLTVERELIPGSHDFDRDRWALFDLRRDFSEAVDLADAEPERVAELERRWWQEATRNRVLPLDDSFVGRAVAMQPPVYPVRPVATYRPGGGPVAEDLLPPMAMGFHLAASLSVDDAAEGVICALGDWSNGWALFLAAGRPVLALSLFGTPVSVGGDAALPEGDHLVAVDYRRVPAGGGPLTLLVDGAVVGSAQVPHDLPFRWQIGGGGLLVGRDTGFPVSEAYQPPYPFSGAIDSVTIHSHAMGAGPDVGRALHHE